MTILCFDNKTYEINLLLCPSSLSSPNRGSPICVLVKPDKGLEVASLKNVMLCEIKLHPPIKYS